jgi:alpha-D-xyloside xylohydrolase
MERRKFISSLGAFSGMMMVSRTVAAQQLTDHLTDPGNTSSHPGIWKFTFGTPEMITPQGTRNVPPDHKALQNLPEVNKCPVNIKFEVNKRGTIVHLPLQPDEYLYGLGLQFQSFQQRGMKKMLRVNADPIVDLGDSHAPVPFFVSTAGYGVFIDTARYATFYMGNKKKKSTVKKESPGKEGNDGWNALNGPYERMGFGTDSEIIVEVPKAKGVDVYVFGGPTFLNVIQRYNLFSGGGVLPPRWGLGFWYRVQSDFKQNEVKKMGEYFRTSKIPCDVLGLEPHWQTHSYSCSYVWSDRFPDPAQMIKDLKADHFRVNLWEHAFVHSSSPIHDNLIPYSGDYLVWDGLVPDFIQKETRKIFGAFHKKEHVDIGVSGYKADECDNSDFTGNWSFPELSKFPSGADGEQTHSLFGLRYQDTLVEVFNQKKERTYGLVRSSGALAAPYPFVLYSDLYNHKTYIHAVAQSSFSGLLWTPEVRDARSNEDLIRRLQSVIFSPLAMINAWYLKNAPWKQIERKANNEGHFADNWQDLETQCREIIELRMKLIPYIHAAFVRYKKEGIPAFKALVIDYPDDPSVRNISNQFIVGDNMIVAPVVEGETNRKIYLPKGIWFDFWSHERYAGKKEYSMDVPLNIIPLFIKAGTILPLAQPTLHTEDPESWNLTALVFGRNEKSEVLYEEDGKYNPALNRVELVWDNDLKEGDVKRTKADALSANQYKVVNWQFID